MGLAEILARDVPERTRTKGNRYFLGGAVRAIEGSHAHVTATVRGSEWYQVHLTRFGDEILASCGCPFFIDRNDFCKHIWAVILASDSEGYLIGDTPLTRDVYLESAYTGGGRSEHAHLEQGRAAASASRQPWQRFLDAVRQRNVVEVPAAPLRYAQGELLYLFDREAMIRDPVPTVQLHWRARKKSGDWGKPQPAAVAASQIDQLPESADREIVSLLVGASDPYGLGGNYASIAARASFRLAGPLIDRVLPLIMQSGRAYLRGAGHRAPEMTPLSWDGGPP